MKISYTKTKSFSCAFINSWFSKKQFIERFVALCVYFGLIESYKTGTPNHLQYHNSKNDKKNPDIYISKIIRIHTENT